MIQNDIFITKEQILHLAKLSQLELSDDEVIKFSVQLSNILKYIDRIKGVSISGDLKRNFKNINTFREDNEPDSCGSNRKEILEEMPEIERGFLVVKKILNN